MNIHLRVFNQSF